MKICEVCFGEIENNTCENCEEVSDMERNQYFESLSDKKTFAPHLEGVTWEREPSIYKYYKEVPHE